MNEYKLREEICEIGRRLYAKGFAAANDGNISYRIGENEVLCSPTMVCKGFLKPEDMCVVDLDGKQLRGIKKRTSEILLHLSVYKLRPDIKAVVHCHPPHATAFAVAHEPIPKCVLPEVEVFLGEIPISVYETPGGQKFADTINPYVKDTNTIILANHGTISFGPDLEKAYWNTEILDSYCRILILAKQLGRVNYFTSQQTQELLDLKKRLGYDDPRFRDKDCDLCANNMIGRGFVEFQPEANAFEYQAPGNAGTGLGTPSNGHVDMDTLVQTITDRVLESLAAMA